MKKTVISLVLIFVMVVGMCGCTNNPTTDINNDENLQNSTITITDLAGDVIELATPVKEIACTWPSGTQLFVTLGMEDLLVAVPKDSQEQVWAVHIAPEIKTLPDCINEQSAEEFLNLDADVVITTETDIARDLRSKGITAITVKWYSVEEMKQGISLISNIVPDEHKKTCNDYLEYLEQQINNVNEALEEKVDKRASLYYIHGNKNKGLYKTAGGGTMNEEWANYAYANFVTSSLLTSSETEVNAEAVLATNPEHIIIGGRYQRVLMDELLNTPEWAEIDAVVNNNIILAPAGISPFDRFGAEFAMMIPWLANQLYPDLYEYDAIKEIKYFYNTFSGYDMTDDEAGYILNGLLPDGTKEIN